MATCEIVTQPFGAPPFNHADILISILSDPRYPRFIASSAFARSSGVACIAEAIKKGQPDSTFFVGINNGVTSIQALEGLCDLSKEVYVVDTAAPALCLFHQKCYAGWGNKYAEIVTGSANLTFSGLNNNIEMSARLRLDFADHGDAKLLDEITSFFSNLRTAYPGYIDQITSGAQLSKWLAEKRLEDEKVSKKGPFTADAETTDQSGNGADGKKAISLPFKPRPKGPGTSTPAPTPIIVEEVAAAPIVVAPNYGPLRWQKADLRGTDAQQPPSAGTNPTGNLRLAQARFATAAGRINHRTYFRNEVFGHLPWVATSADTETAPIQFRIIASGANQGTFTSQVSHAPKRIAGQNNVPTVLHWGPAIQTVRDANVVGETLSLYGPDEAGIYTIGFTP